MRLAYLTEYMARQDRLDASVYRKLTKKSGGGPNGGQSLADMKGKVLFLREIFSDVVPRRKRKQKDRDGATEGRG